MTATVLLLQEDEQGSSTTAVKIQARGCKSGSVWDDRAYSDVKRLLINHDGGVIFSVQIEYINENGKAIRGAHHGNDRGYTDKVDLDYPNEYLTSIYGYYRSFQGNVDYSNSDDGIKSVTLETNTKTWGPYGKEEGIKFSFPIMRAKIVGFHGWSSNYGLGLRAIGVYVQPIAITKSKPQLKPQAEDYFSLGRYGCEDGEFWEETFGAIKRLVIYSDDQWINSIQMEYEDENGELVLSKKHGGDGGSPSEVVFEYPDEHLVTINGYYDNSLDSKSATNMIRSLTVKTNKKTSGPYGFDSFEDGTEFLFPTDGQLKVVGIHGRSDLYLNAIGLYVVLI